VPKDYGFVPGDRVLVDPKSAAAFDVPKLKDGRKQKMVQFSSIRGVLVEENKNKKPKQKALNV